MLDFAEAELTEALERIVMALGLALKAGKCIVGTDLSVDSIRAKKAALAFMPSDVSDNTRKRITDSCNYHNVHLIVLPCSKEFLGKKLGKKAGVSCAVIADKSFVKIVEKIYVEIHTRFTEVHK